jgi:hypothetical protein
MFLLLTVAILSTSCSVPTPEIGRQTALEYDAFDSQPAPFGWRALVEAGCTDAAVSLLSAYEHQNSDQLPKSQRLEVAFHQGQALAMSGDDARSIPHFERALGSGGDDEWSTYVDATLAFLKRDTRALQKARDTYARISPGSMRLLFLDGMLACPNERYAKAVHCKM